MTFFMIFLKNFQKNSIEKIQYLSFKYLNPVVENWGYSQGSQVLPLNMTAQMLVVFGDNMFCRVFKFFRRN